MSNGQNTAIFGWIFMGSGIIYLIMGLTGELGMSDKSSLAALVTLVVLTCCGSGYILISRGNKYKNWGQAIARYSALIPSIEDGSLDAIAVTFPKPYVEVCKDLQKMIDQGFLPECYLDLQRRLLVSPHMKFRQVASTIAPITPIVHETPVQPASPKYKVVKCPNCNGSNAITDSKFECDYCGAPLE